MARSFILAAALTAAFTAPALAEADGPDYFRVTGVATTDVLNMRSGPSPRAPRIATIPPNANGLRNLGCVGGLTFAQWQAATPAQRQKGRASRWCKVEWRGAVGWAAGTFLAEGAGR